MLWTVFCCISNRWVGAYSISSLSVTLKFSRGGWTVWSQTFFHPSPVGVPHPTAGPKLAPVKQPQVALTHLQRLAMSRTARRARGHGIQSPYSWFVWQYAHWFDCPTIEHLLLRILLSWRIVLWLMCGMREYKSDTWTESWPISQPALDNEQKLFIINGTRAQVFIL